MASLSNDPNGRKRIQFDCPNSQKRKTLRLGKIDLKTAQTVRVHVEHLITAKLAGVAVPQTTAVWLKSISNELRNRLVKTGLISEEVETPLSPLSPLSLKSFLEEYLARQTHVKPASLLATKQVVRNLLDYFSPDCTLADINAGRADDFRKWLLSGGRSYRQKNRSLSGATVAKRLQRCSAIFADALRRKMIAENPFLGLKRPPARNRERQQYIPVETVSRLINEYAPSNEWRLLLSLARHLGLRVPSEPFSLTWDCVDWERRRLRILSPKTEVHGKTFRMVPILPEVLPHLESVYENAPEGSIYVFQQLRERDSVRAAQKGFWASLNLRQQLMRMLTRAGISPWPRLWHNLRASAQTDLANCFPAHVVCEWLGNTQAVAQQHYLQVTEDHFAQAITGGAKSDAKAAQKATQQGDALNCTEQQKLSETQEPQEDMHNPAAQCDTIHNQGIAAIGFEHLVKSSKNTNKTHSGGAKSDAIDLQEIGYLWRELTLPQQAELLALAQRFLEEKE